MPATVEACDNLGGVLDGIISAPDKCDFDPYSLVAKSFECSEEESTISTNDAAVVQRLWDCSRQTDGSLIWYGMSKGTCSDG